MPAIDAGLGAGARAIRLETWFDRSAPGTGWGLRGIGDGSGIGTGAGFSVGTERGRSAALPSVSIGSPSASGDLDKATIRRDISSGG